MVVTCFKLALTFAIIGVPFIGICALYEGLKAEITEKIGKEKYEKFTPWLLGITIAWYVIAAIFLVIWLVLFIWNFREIFLT